MNERIHMSSPDVGELEEQYIVNAVRSGWIAPLGPDVDAFEDELKARLGVEHAVALSSGTAALHLGLLALGVGTGDVVVTSSMTFAATANAITYTGATPYFVDSLPDTGNMDPELLREALDELVSKGSRVAAIVPVDLLGKAVDYTAIESVADEYGIPLLCDAAESLGATHQGKPAGSFGSASIVSFNGNKIMTTSGGGMLLTNDSELAARIRYLATQARQPVAHYEHTDVGYNYRLSNLLAALGRAQLTRLNDMIARRKALRDQYRQFFAKVSGVEIFGGATDAEDNYWLTSIIVDSELTGWTSQDFQRALSQDSIEARPLWKPMHLQPIYSNAPRKVNGSSESLFLSGLTLPSGSALHDEQVDRIFTSISNFLAQGSTEA
ncbi:aminotransferase class I/II-fold pyridoxal phosphate-dependent enzyme [Zhihengliuella sp.]|uniref:DegT/DnrJ/EryC1/StrS family aminotransferase n=1 Tax=Zhihengliuella sp. TaxID=1954483 RepID=UPI002810C70E|nr:aminotransferase class I/II-fold pyridoxal phosphate-dependent enzyme [Zhihengliuella sp.]